MVSEINLPLSLINLFLTYAVWFGKIRDDKAFFNLRANVLEINLESTFISVFFFNEPYEALFQLFH